MTDTGELNRGEQDNSESKSDKRGMIPLVGFTVGVVVVSSLGIASGIKDSAEADAYRAVQSPVIAAAIHNDGLGFDHEDQSSSFDNFGPYFGRESKEIRFTVDLGNCLFPLEADVEKDANNNVTEVHNYRFDGYSLAKRVTVSERRGTNGRNTYDAYDGLPIEFTFDNAQQLQDEVLGDEPCRVLAESYVPPTTVQR